MKISRLELLGDVKTVRPALADKSPIEGLTHIWFTGTTAAAYNDVIGIELPCNLELSGGLMGTTLFGLLEHSSVMEVEIEDHNTEVQVKFGGAKAKLPILPIDMAVLPFPDNLPEGAVTDSVFCAALEHVMLSVASTGLYGSSGVTLIMEGKDLAFYATDGRTVSWARIPLPAGYNVPRVLLSGEWCKQFRVLCNEGSTLHFTEDRVVAVSVGNVRLLGRLLDEEKPHNFAEVVAENVPKGSKPTPVPEKLAMALDRARVFSVGGQAVKVAANIDAGVLRLSVRTDLGEMHEAIRLAEPAPAKKITSAFDAELVAKGLGHAQSFLLNDNAFVLLYEGGAGYMAAVPV